MKLSEIPDEEPVGGASLLTTALLSTVAVLGLVFKWQRELIEAINFALAGWVLFVGWLVRKRVIPLARLLRERGVEDVDA